MFEVSVPDPAEVRVLDDAALIDAIRDCARVAAAAEARKLAAVAELARRRCTDPEHPGWACDDTDAAAAEVAAALTLGHGRALRLLDLAVMLRDRMPKVGALFLAGAITARTVTVIDNRTYLVRDPDALAEVDAVLAERATSWGPLSEYKLIQAIDVWVDNIDPGRCAAPAPTPATATSPSLPPTNRPAPPLSSGACCLPMPPCSTTASRRWPAGCVTTTPAPWPNAAPMPWARWPPAPPTSPANARTPAVTPPPTTAGPPASSSTSWPSTPPSTPNPTRRSTATTPARLTRPESPRHSLRSTRCPRHHPNAAPRA